jgi:cellulose/xylan binding protein with CBM9 domain
MSMKLRHYMRSMALAALILPISILIGQENTVNRTYLVRKMQNPLAIDANWEKKAWLNAECIYIDQILGEKPGFIPRTEARLMYDERFLYVIFRVRDRFVKALTTKSNGPVYEDSCVELFFSPDSTKPLQYFNLEVNCGATPLMRYSRIPKKDYTTVGRKDLKQIEIAATMPTIVYPEIQKDTTWIIEYSIPFKMIEEYARISHPKPGVIWKANLYKIGDLTSNPHYLTWAPIESPVPNFHLPKFFGTLVFE